MQLPTELLELLQDSNPVMVRILIDVLMEGERAQVKHGTPSPNPLRGTTILGEEYGEACEAALKMTSLNPTEKENQTDFFWLHHLRSEYVQVASVALRQILNIDTGRTTEWLLNNQPQKTQ